MLISNSNREFVCISDELSQRFKLMAVISSFLVVSIHCCSNFQVASPLIRCGVYDGICRIAVPFFFLTSGFFLAGAMNKDGWWRRECVKRFHSLVIPYLIWITFFIGFINLLAIIKYVVCGTAFCYNFPLSIGSLIKYYGLNPLCHPVLLPLWYIRSLLILVFISPALLWTMKFVNSKSGNGWIFCILAFVLYLWLGRWEGIGGNTTYFFRKFLALQGLFYFSLGMAWRLGYIQLRVSRRQASAMLLAGILIMAIKTILHINGFPHYHLLGSCSVPLLLVAIFNLLPCWHLPECIASCAFPIYIIHMFTIKAIQTVVPTVGGAGFVAMVVAVYAITFTLVVLQRKHLGWLNRWLWGGR